MKRNLLGLVFLMILALACVGTVCAQDNQKEKIAILPFTGGSGTENEAVAEMLSYKQKLRDRFGIIPRTDISTAVGREQSFQHTSGMTDEKTISKLGEQFGAKYVLAGSISAVGNQKILIVTIVKVETIEQVAGDYVFYRNETQELPKKFDAMLQKILPMVDSNRDALPKLAVVPVQMEGADRRTADTLAQVLSIELLKINGYAIYPRTSSLDQVRQEYRAQSGLAAERYAAQVGFGVNPEYVLSVVARKLGTQEMFNAEIIDLQTAESKVGTSESYAQIENGISVMRKIASVISGNKTALAAADKSVQTDALLRSTGIHFALEGTGSIFQTPGTHTYTDKDTGEKKESSNSTGGGGFAIKAAPYWYNSWVRIGLETGVKFDFYPVVIEEQDTILRYTSLQIPVLLRVNSVVGPNADANTIALVIGFLGGIGFNAPIKADNATMHIPPNWIIGGEVGWRSLKNPVSFFVLVQYAGAIGEASVDMDNGYSHKFSRSAVEFGAGLKILVPFRKSSNF